MNRRQKEYIQKLIDLILDVNLIPLPKTSPAMAGPAGPPTMALY